MFCNVGIESYMAGVLEIEKIINRQVGNKEKKQVPTPTSADYFLFQTPRWRDHN